MTGQGMKSFFSAVDEARQEYETDYKPELDRLSAERAAKSESEKKAQLDRLMKDMSVADRGGSTTRSTSASGNAEAGGSRRRGGNPFGPHGINEREDRQYDESINSRTRSQAADDEAESDSDSEEKREIRRQEEEEDEAEYEQEYGAADEEYEVGEIPSTRNNNIAGGGLSWPRPS